MIRTLLLLVCLTTPVLAVEPDEVLDDPVLEERARALGQELRCPVCRNESIDESNADLAKDLRVLVRQRLLEGDSNTEVKAFLVARYGEYVLLKPPFSVQNIALWLTAPVLLLVGGAIAFALLRQRSTPRMAANPSELSEDETERLKALLEQHEDK